jgi:hypothetical protein
MPMPKEIQELLMALSKDIQSKVAEEKAAEPKPLSFEEQLTRLKTFMTSQSFSVGTRVVRNAFGEQRYRFPAKDQAAVITAVFDKPMLDDDGNVVHGEVAVVHEDGEVRTFTVDFRYYRKAQEA